VKITSSKNRDRVETLRIFTKKGEDVEGDLYELVGGKPFFVSLCAAFYAGVKDDELLRPMYPGRRSWSSGRKTATVSRTVLGRT